MTSSERGMGITRKKADKRLWSEIGDIGEGQMPGGWALSLKKITERKNKGSGIFNSGGGYYNGTAICVKEMIRAFEHPEERMLSSASSAGIIILGEGPEKGKSYGVYRE